MNNDLIKFYLPTNEEQLEVALHLLEKLAIFGIVNYSVYEVLEESVKNNNLIITSENELSADYSYFDGYWRFEFMVDKEAIKAFKVLSKDVICYIANQTLLTLKSDIKRAFEVQELYVKFDNSPDGKVVFGYYLKRIEPF